MAVISHTRPDPLTTSSSSDDHHVHGQYARRPDLLEPHILRSLANVPITSIHGSASACHFVALDTSGNAWLFGRNQPPSCGVPARYGYVSEQAPKKLTPQRVGAPKGVEFVHAAVGRSHSLLVGSNGDVWSAGANTMGQVQFLAFRLSLLRSMEYSAAIHTVRKYPSSR